MPFAAGSETLKGQLALEVSRADSTFLTVSADKCCTRAPYRSSRVNSPTWRGDALFHARGGGADTTGNLARMKGLTLSPKSTRTRTNQKERHYETNISSTFGDFTLQCGLLQEKKNQDGGEDNTGCLLPVITPLMLSGLTSIFMLPGSVWASCAEHRSSQSVSPISRKSSGRRGYKCRCKEATLTAYDGTQLEAMNIIGSYRPEAKTRVMLFAHWDTRPVADHDPDPSKRSDPIQVRTMVRVVRECCSRDCPTSRSSRAGALGGGYLF